MRQGDPLSPLLFNMVNDFIVGRLRSFIGVNINDDLLSSSAFADDLLLFAGSTMGLQIQLEKTAKFLDQCNLSINNSKSFTISFLVDGKNKKVKIADSKFKINGAPLRALRPGEEFRYLGVYYRADGLLFYSSVRQIDEWLDKLAKAPLKPQQRVCLLRDYLLPKIMHLAVLSRINAGVLNKSDRRILAFLRKHLNIPHDALNAFFHASIKDGGLGIPSLRTLVPTLRLNRLEAIRKNLSSYAGSGFVSELLHDHIRRSIELAVPGDHGSYWRERMLVGVGGVGLRESYKTPGQNNWVRGNQLFLSGRDYINSIKLKFNALSCRSRCSRGRTNDRLCRAGCRRPETLAHILQVCPRTFGQ